MRGIKSEQKEKLDLRKAIDRSPKPGYLSFEIGGNLISEVSLKNEIRCYGVERRGGIPSGSGVIANDIYNSDSNKLVLFSIKNLVRNNYFNAETKEVVIKVDGREIFRKGLDFCCSMFVG